MPFSKLGPRLCGGLLFAALIAGCAENPQQTASATGTPAASATRSAAQMAEAQAQWREFRKQRRATRQARADAYAHWLQMIHTADGRIAPDGLARAFDDREALIARQGTTTRDAGLAGNRWVALGPTNVPGRVRAIAYDTTDRSGKTVWFGGAAGGLYKSTDGAATWTPVTSFLSSLAISTIAIDPSDGRRIYIGTGERLGGFYDTQGAGVFLSVDGGETWQRLPATNPALDAGWATVSRLAIAPGDSRIILAAAKGGIYRSIDGGAKFDKIAVEGVTDTPTVFQVAFDPNNAANAIAGLGGGGVAYSTDGGAKFTAVSTGVTETTGQGRVELAYAASTRGRVIASINGWDTKTAGKAAGSVRLSDDGGKTWRSFKEPGHLGTQGDYDNTIWIAPDRDDLIVVGGIELYRSTGGGNFEAITNWDNFNINGTVPHADQHAIVSPPNFSSSTNPRVIVGNDGGLYAATDIGRANGAAADNYWLKASTNVLTTQFMNIVAFTDKSSGSTVYVGGAQDNGNMISAGGGAWQQLEVGDGGMPAVDPADPSVYYFQYINGSITRATATGELAQPTKLELCAKTDNTGAIDNYLPDGGQQQCKGAADNQIAFYPPILVDPTDNNRLVVGAAHLWTMDRARTGAPSRAAWRAVKGLRRTSPDGDLNITAMAMTAKKPGRVWLGFKDGVIAYADNVFDANRAPAWVHFDPFMEGACRASAAGHQGKAQRAVLNLLIDRNDPDKVYVGMAGYNAGNVLSLEVKDRRIHCQASDLSNGLPQVPVMALAQHPTKPAWIYVGTEIGLYSSENGGLSWSTANDGPGATIVAGLAWAPDGKTLLAATHGRGLWAQVPDLDPAATPRAGLWSDAAVTGRAVAVERTALNALRVGVASFDADGRSVWYYGAGPIDGATRSDSVALQTYSGKSIIGAAPDGRVAAAGTAGTFKLTFSDPNAARLVWTAGSASFDGSLTHDASGQSSSDLDGTPNTGWWYDPTVLPLGQGGDGAAGARLFIEARGNGNSGTDLSLLLFDFDAQGRPVWYQSHGTAQKGATGFTYAGNLMACERGAALWSPGSEPACRSVGQIELAFSGTATVTASFPNRKNAVLVRSLN